MLLSSERDRVPCVSTGEGGRVPCVSLGEGGRISCVSTGEGQGPLCVPGGGGQGPLCVHWGGSRVPCVSLGEGGRAPLGGPGRGGQGPLGGPGEGGRAPCVSLGRGAGSPGWPWGVPLESRPHFLSLYSLSRGGPQGSLAPPACLSHSARPSPAPAPALRPAVCLAGHLSGRPSVWPAVCLAGLWEKEAAVCVLNQRWGTQPAAGWASPGGAGLWALPTWASTAACPLQEASLDPGPGWAPRALLFQEPGLPISSQDARVAFPRGRMRQEGPGNPAGPRGCCWAPGLRRGGRGGCVGCLALQQAAWLAPPGCGPTRAALAGLLSWRHT